MVFQSVVGHHMQPPVRKGRLALVSPVFILAATAPMLARANFPAESPCVPPILYIDLGAPHGGQRSLGLADESHNQVVYDGRFNRGDLKRTPGFKRQVSIHG